MASSELQSAVKWLALAALVWAGATVLARLRQPAVTPPQTLPSWQRPVSALPAAEHAAWQRIREGITTLERQRGASGSWPEPGDALFPGWTRRQQRLAVNYVGEAAGLRWLVLFLEPEPPRAGVAAEPPAPEDEEHHTLSDGTALHVTVWTQATTEPPPELVLAFPANEGWTQQVSVTAPRSSRP